MGYDLHITRKEFWADETGPAILKKDWDQYVNSDPEISQDTNNTEDDYLVKESGELWPIWWNPDLNEIYTKNPSESAIRKLKQIAEKLNAQVQGDDGEIY